MTIIARWYNFWVYAMLPIPSTRSPVRVRFFGGPPFLLHVYGNIISLLCPHIPYAGQPLLYPKFLLLFCGLLRRGIPDVSATPPPSPCRPVPINVGHFAFTGRLIPALGKCIYPDA
jgi:hypothetical protein